MLTARDDEVDKVVGLEIGADDYEPSRFRRANWWRESGPCCARRNDAAGGETTTQSGLFHCGDITLDVARRIVTKGDEELPVNPKSSPSWNC
jgi:DNA-binding response OmpR family regulator